MYNEWVVFGLAYHYHVIAPALQLIFAILVQAFHKLEPECYRNGLLQHIAMACYSTTDFGNESCRDKNRVMLHVVTHIYIYICKHLSLSLYIYI